MKCFWIGLLLLLAGFCRGQTAFLNRDKAPIKKKLEAHTRWNELQTKSVETDTSFIYCLRDAQFRNFDCLFHFDEQGKCDREVAIFYCSICLRQNVEGLLARHRWYPVGNQAYYSRYADKLVLTVGAAALFLQNRTPSIKQGSF
ncbi:MAG: hypothetical protein U0T84_02520 [Chitinophagales bacterium]